MSKKKKKKSNKSYVIKGREKTCDGKLKKKKKKHYQIVL